MMVITVSIPNDQLPKQLINNNQWLLLMMEEFRESELIMEFFSDGETDGLIIHGGIREVQNVLTEIEIAYC